MSHTKFKDLRAKFEEMLSKNISDVDIAKELKVNLRTVYHWKKKVGVPALSPNGVVKGSEIPKEWVSPIVGRRFIITSALNDTKVDAGFLAALLAMAKDLDAQIITIPITYKNPDLYFKMDKENLSQWPEELAGTYISGNVQLGKNLAVIASFSISATCSEPLSGLNGVAGVSSAILGHPRQDMSYHPANFKDLPRMYSTTGTVSSHKRGEDGTSCYSKSKAGGKADTHHVIGAMIVELDADDKLFFARHLEWMGDILYDISGAWNKNGKVPRERLIDAVALGDVHCPYHDRQAWDATLALLDEHKPHTVVAHDFIDAYTVSPHDARRGVLDSIKGSLGLRSLFEEIEISVNELARLCKPGRKVYMPVSNHHDHIDRWLLERGHKDHRNFALWTQMMARYSAQASISEIGELSTPDAFRIGMEVVCAANNVEVPEVHWLAPGEELEVKGMRMAAHGHVGPGGKRGSIKGFSSSLGRAMYGHIHTPGKYKGVFVVPCLSYLNRGYKLLADNTWVQGVGVVYPNGAAAILNCIEGKYRP